jgi:predicted RNA-binding Zn-ribbon protein involved in translation (DUF1610 family)
MSEPKHQYVSNTGQLHRRQSLELVVNRSCPHCGAPAFYRSHESIKNGWPGAWVAPQSSLEGHFVGEVCPNCHLDRNVKSESHGEVWSREWRSPSEARPGVFRRILEFFRRWA